jgi:tetratricopeptide (TPR) repeat protein
MVQNFHLVWLDGSIDEVNNDDCHNSVTQLRQVVNTVNTFTDADECINFITDINEEKTFMIVSGALCQIIVPIAQYLSQVSSIYIFCENEARYGKWAQQWPKVNGVYTDIISICEALKQAAQDCDQNSISISFVKMTDGASNQNLDTLDQSFMYTQILKEILLTIDFEPVRINEFLTYCRAYFADNSAELKNADKLEKEYIRHQAIWWYTYECFLYSMLNRALHTMEVDHIIKMSFFVRDLHYHIAALHFEQYGGHEHAHSFTVYRGQGLSQTDLDQLKQTQGELLSFNNFLSTSKNLNVALDFARRTIATSDLVGVLFVMKIKPSISTTPFANVRDASYHQREDEILFSLHSVFRIGRMKQIEKNDRLWQVHLTLTSNDDPQLHALTERMRDETFPHLKGWYRLGNLLVKLGQFDKAQQVFDIMLDETTEQGEKADIYHMLGMVKNSQGKYKEAVEFHEKSIKISRKTLSPTHSDLASSYANLGLAYDNMGEYSKALWYYEKALEIYRKTLPLNHLDLGTSYNNIGNVYDKMGEYSKALSSHEKALDIRQKTLPANHPHLATSYNNIGWAYDNMGEYSKALSSYQKALEIAQKTLPLNHPSLATSYSNIGQMYINMGEHWKAVSYYEKALEIRQKTLPADHPDLATSYNNIGWVYENMSQYSKALSYYAKDLEICQKTLPANHPHLAVSYNNIASIYDSMREYSKAHSYLVLALDILQRSLPPYHPDIQNVRLGIQIVQQNCK